jgi:hypothetical protein
MASFESVKDSAIVEEDEIVDENEIEPEKEFNEWVEDEDDESELVQSLFSEAKLRNIEQLIEFDSANFGFDLNFVVKTFCSDDFSYIKLINFIRSFPFDSNLKELSIRNLMEALETRQFLEGEQYLRPIMEDDALLFKFDEIFEFEGNDIDDIDIRNQTVEIGEKLEI